MNKKIGFNQIVKDSFSTLLSKVVLILLGVFNSMFLARYLGPEGNGIYSISTMIPSVFCMLLSLGVPSSNIYHIAKKPSLLFQISKINKNIFFIMTSLGFFCGFIIIYFFSDKLFPEIPQLFLYIAFLSFPVLLYRSFLISIFQGLQNFRKYNYLNIVSKVISVLALLLFAYLLEIKGAIIAFVIGNFLGLLIVFFQLKPFIKRQESDVLNKNRFLSFGLKSYFNHIIAFLNYKVDIFLVNYFLSPFFTGIYVVAVALAEQIWIITSSISIVIGPKLTEISNQKQEHSELTLLTMKWVFYFTLIIVILLFFLIDFIINFLYGLEYLSVSTPFILLLPGIVFAAMSKIISNSFVSLGKPEINLYVGGLVFCINIILNIILIPLYGLNGAAIATSASYILTTILKMFIYKNISDIHISKIFLFNKNDLFLIKKLYQKVISRNK